MSISVRRNFRRRALAELRGTPPERKLYIFRQEMIVPPEVAAGDGAPGHSYLTTPGIVSDPVDTDFQNGVFHLQPLKR